MSRCVVAIISICLSIPLSIRAADETVRTGQRIAEQKCAVCHSFAESSRDWADIASSGGPDLFYAGSKFKKEWLAKWLVAPSRIRPAGFLPFRYVESTPAGDVVDEQRLPLHPEAAKDEAPQLVEYLLSLKKDVNPYPMAGGSAIRAEVHFQKILPCGGCHRVEGKGGISGPELLDAAARMNREWLFSFIADPAYWTKELMPKVTLRADQLSAIGEYLLTAPAARDVHSPSSPLSVKPSNISAPPHSDWSSRAEMLYQMFCSQCHGIHGNGKGINAPYLFVKPRDHTSLAEMGALTDDRLFAAIKFGGTAVNKSSLMPSWGATLKDSDIQLLVDYLRVLSGTKTQE